MVVIDTCSLVSLARYYLPLDASGFLYHFIKEKIEGGEIIVIDEVFEECKYYGKGMAAKALPYLKDVWTSTVDCLPDRNFFNLADLDFVNPVMRKKLTSEEFELAKTEFLEGADAKQILYCLRHKTIITDFRIVTEETEGSNDNKTFKKIPTISKRVGIKTITVTDLLLELGVQCTFE